MMGLFQAVAQRGILELGHKPSSATKGRALLVGLALLAWLIQPAFVHADSSVLTRKQMTGDWFGLRTTLGNAGVHLGATEWAVPTWIIAGGARQGITYSGELAPFLSVNFGKLIGIHGLTAVVSAGVPQGPYGPTSHYLYNLNDVTFTEGPMGVYLDDAFLHQSLFADGLSIQLGQFGVDENFDQNPVGAVFLNSDFAYREIDGADMPGGGPVFPEDSLGARVRVSPSKAFSLQAAIFSGTPRPVTSSGGIASTFNNGAMIVGEADLDYTIGGLGSGHALVGALYNTLTFPNLETGASLKGNEVIYAALNQTFWQGSKDRNLAAFVRGAWAPPDRNLIMIDAQAGLAWTGPFSARPDDVLGLAFGYDGIGSSQINLIQDQNAAGGTPQPIPDYEMVAELAYQIEITPWWSVTPDLQYIVHPGGNIADPLNSSITEPDAFVALLQATVTL